MIYSPKAPGNFKRLLEIVSAGIPLPLKSINNKRSIVSLENIVDFLKICGNTKEAANQIFLISEGDDVSISELIDLVSFGMGKKTRLFSLNPKFLKLLAKIIGGKYLHTQITASLQIDISKAKSLLSWTPPIASDEAMILTGRRYACEKIV
jgi:nucleoside-diphosphate-sugar epimerase